MIAEILTPWYEWTDDEGLNRISLIESFLVDNNFSSWSLKDVTEQPAETISAGLVVIELTATPEIISAIQADSRFLILWSE